MLREGVRFPGVNAGSEVAVGLASGCELEHSVPVLPRMSDLPSQRLFVGIRPPAAVCNEIARQCDLWRNTANQKNISARWVSPASYHLTLGFLGWTRPEIMPALKFELSQALAGQKGFDVELHGTGGFPAQDNANVGWLAVHKGNDRLTELSGRIQAVLAELGFAASEAPHVPHLTVARFDPPANLGDWLRAEQIFRFFAGHIELLESRIVSGSYETARIAVWSLDEVLGRQIRQMPLVEEKHLKTEHDASSLESSEESASRAVQTQGSDYGEQGDTSS